MNETEIDRLVVRLMGDQQNLQQVMDSAVVTAERTRDKLESVDIAKGILGADAIKAAGQTIVNTVGEIIGAWEEQQAANIALEATLVSHGEAATALFATYSDFASEIQGVTTMADENVLSLLTQAETFGLTGDAAKQAAKDAIALAALPGARGGEQTMLRLAQAIQTGDTASLKMFQRLLPQLRSAKSETELLAKAQELVGIGWGVVERQSQTFTGQMKQLRNTVSDLYEDFGKIIVDVLTPFVTGLKLGVTWLKGLSDETKRWIVIAGGIVAASAFASVGLAIRRAIPFVNLFGIAIKAALSPIGLIAIGLIGLGYAFVRFTDAGKTALEWVKSAWADMGAYMGDAIQGVKNAIAAGNLELAVKIMWKQAEVAWVEGLNNLKVHNTSFREHWINFRDFLASGFVIAQGAGTAGGSGWKQQLEMLREMTEFEKSNINASVAKMRDELKTMIDQAGKEAEDAARNKGKDIGSSIGGGIKEGLQKFQAVDVRSAESFGRVLDYLDGFGVTAKTKAGKAGKAVRDATTVVQDAAKDQIEKVKKEKLPPMPVEDTRQLYRESKQRVREKLEAGKSPVTAGDPDMRDEADDGEKRYKRAPWEEGYVTVPDVMTAGPDVPTGGAPPGMSSRDWAVQSQRIMDDANRSAAETRQAGSQKDQEKRDRAREEYVAKQQLEVGISGNKSGERLDMIHVALEKLVQLAEKDAERDVVEVEAADLE